MDRDRNNDNWNERADAEQEKEDRQKIIDVLEKTIEPYEYIDVDEGGMYFSSDLWTDILDTIDEAKQ